MDGRDIGSFFPDAEKYHMSASAATRNKGVMMN
jgi:cytidylate kinase